MTDQLHDSARGNDLHANMEKLTHDWLDQSVQDANAAPTSDVARVAQVTAKGLAATPKGLVDAVVDDCEHWGRTLGTVATSAGIGAALKVVLPESGMAGKIAGAGIATYFLAKSLEPAADAYSKAWHAKTKKDMDEAGNELGGAAGGFVVNTAVAGFGYKLGAGYTSKALMSEKLDGFAALKEKVWNPKGEAPVEAGEPGIQQGMASRVKIEGNRATLLNSEKMAPKNSVVKGEVDPEAQMNVTVYAQTKGNAFMMDRDLARINAGMRGPLTEAELTSKYGAKPESMDAIKKFAEDNGLKVTDHNLASGRVQLTGSTGQMMKAFDVKLTEYQHESGISFRGREGAVSVSTDLAPHVKAVLGLDNRPAFKTNYVKLQDANSGGGATAGDASKAGIAGQTEARAPKPNADGARALTPEEMLKAYNADPKYDGSGMTTGFISLGGTLDGDWQGTLRAKGIDPKTVEFRNTSSEAPTSDPGGANGENRLDFYMHKYGLPKAKTVMVESPNDDTGMPNALDRITSPKPGETQITHASISWGMYEDGWTAQSRALMEEAGKRAALKGVTVTVASGDDGAGDRSPSRRQQVDLPAGLEHFTGVGGTRLSVDANGAWKGEVGWDGMGASGGGRSMFTPRPEWQKGINMPDNLNGSKFDGRGVPDIASTGDPRSGMITPGPEGSEAIGGTSLSAPTAAVKAAIISQATGKPTGYWNPEIYKMAKSNPGVFHDIVSGRNSDGGVKGYPSTPGYDLQTGNGSIDVGKYIAARSKGLNQNAFSRNLGEATAFLNPKNNVTPLVIPFQGAHDTQLEKK